MTQSILDLINSNAFYTERALDATCKDKVFVVADLHNNKIASFNRTIYGAEFFLKTYPEYYHYYAAYNGTPDKIQIVSPLQIFEIPSDKITGYDPDYAY